MALVGKKSSPEKFRFDRSGDARASKCVLDRAHTFRRHLANKFQSYVNSFRSHPARAARHTAQPRDHLTNRTPHLIRNIERDEEPHGLSLGARRVKKISPHHIQCRIRRLRADALAVAGKSKRAFL